MFRYIKFAVILKKTKRLVRPLSTAAQRNALHIKLQYRNVVDYERSFTIRDSYNLAQKLGAVV